MELADKAGHWYARDADGMGAWTWRDGDQWARSAWRETEDRQGYVTEEWWQPVEYLAADKVEQA